MSLIHLRQGSSCPKLAPGVLRCYNMRFCPFAQKTLLTLHAKDIDHEIVNIHLKDRPDWFLKKNPLGKVPVLEQDGRVLIESDITCEYLDEKYPEPPMLPRDPWTKARVKSLMEIVNAKIATPLLKLFYKMADPTLLIGMVSTVQDGLEIMEQELAERKTPYFGGTTTGLLDYAFWPWIERFPVVSHFTNGEIELFDENRFPKLREYIALMNTDKAVKATRISVEEHLEFIMSFATGEPNYDIGLEKINKL